MKLADQLSTAHTPFYTFEFFPPRTDQGFSNLLARISRLAELKPLAISVTWGAGGSTKERTLELAALTQKEYEIDTIMHLTCTNMEKGMVDEALRAAKAIGIQNIMALRGDPPRGEEYWIPTDPRFAHAADLVSYIRSHPEFSDAFSIGVAGYPDGHADKALSEEDEFRNLKAKVDAGADFIVTQLFYDVDNFLLWVKKVRATGITVPIIPGVMPLQTYASFLRLTKLCGTNIPAALQAELEPIKHDDQKIKDFGVTLAVSMIKRLEEGGIRGFHFCTLNLEKSVQRTLELLQWAPRYLKPQNKLIADTPDDVVHPLSTDHPDFVVTPANAASTASNGLVGHLAGGEGDIGKGEANNAATWDEFPNGRFGDVNSPAFGSQDMWGGFSRLNTAATEWARPQTHADVTAICLRFLASAAPSWPFSPAPLSLESQLILPHLQRLARAGWWPVGSQPAVDGANSADPVVGWGPAGGYVYQKPFVEFFVGEDVVRRLEARVRAQGNGLVNVLAGNNAGELRTNVQEGERNAVTWGVFPGQEIVQSTIIEQESFLTWKDEAFSIWTDWASLFPPESPERKLLEDIRDTRWLVNVTHHNFKDPEALWDFLSEDLGDQKILDAR
ncbi:methylenetetrahydrofolate reduct [Auriscalpium vulgare]|uniref:Methylenetetrahydrofolate reduct n=1 Tax=Auriscalpium vulgare TaxID=40419 RepID=A0ACB8RFM8_9AGAM|nr:methylenetetrahydrofolate reduct [Auriscalpium vulgare]